MKRQLILALGIALTGCSDKGNKQAFEASPVPVQVAEVEMRDVPLYFEAMGVVKPSRSAEIKPQVNGIIKEVHFTEGEWVEEGDLLYTIDNAAYAIRVQEVEAQLDQDIAHLNNAMKKLERYKSLTKQDLISKVEWDDLETKVALHEAMIKADQARLAAAKLDLEHCRITAPIAGFTSKSALNEGSMAAGATLLTLTQTDPLSVDFSITEKELQQITTSAPLIKVYAAGNEECLAVGKVTFMDHSVDHKTGMLAASGTLESLPINSRPYDHVKAPAVERSQMDQHCQAKLQKNLWPGQSVCVHLYFGKKEKALLVPMRAVKTNQEGPYLFAVKEDNTVEVRSIKLGPEEKGQIIIEEGLEGADKVVIEGQSRLFSGSKIEEVR